MTSPGTKSRAAGVTHLPSRLTLRLDGKLRLQRLDGIAGLPFFPEADAGIRNEQKKNDEEIRPVPDDPR